MDYFELRENAVHEEFSQVDETREYPSYAKEIAARASITVTRSTNEEVEFDLVGVDVSLANVRGGVAQLETTTKRRHCEGL